MPGFTIRRKKKVQPKPLPKTEEPEPEQKNDDVEMSEESEAEYIDERIKEAQMQTRPQPPKMRPRYEQERHVRYQEPPNYASQRPNYVEPQYDYNPRRQYMDPYRRKATMRIPPKPDMGRSSSTPFRFGSHYGANSAAMTTQQKSQLLYTHCFG